MTSLEKLERFRLEPSANTGEDRWTLALNVLNPQGGLLKDLKVEGDKRYKDTEAKAADVQRALAYWESECNTAK